MGKRKKNTVLSNCDILMWVYPGLAFRTLLWYICYLDNSTPKCDSSHLKGPLIHFASYVL